MSVTVAPISPAVGTEIGTASHRVMHRIQIKGTRAPRPYVAAA